MNPTQDDGTRSATIPGRCRDHTQRDSPSTHEQNEKPYRKDQLHPAPHVRNAYASAMNSLEAGTKGDGNDKAIASSLKSKVRRILEEEGPEKHQARSLLTAATALTSLCDVSSDRSSPVSETETDGNDSRKSTTSPDRSESTKPQGKTHENAPPKKSISSRDDVPMTFPQKLMEILEDKRNDHIITWLPHGKAFIIYQKKKFASEILPRYFKESKYTSFTRKLNRWGFVRVTKGPEIGAYYHKCFQQGNYLLCMQMCCQSVNKARQMQAESIINTTPSPLSTDQLPFLLQGQIPYPRSMLALSAFSGRSAVGAFPTNPPSVQPGLASVELLSQQLKVLNMAQNRNLQNTGTFMNQPVTTGTDAYSSAVINAAIDALQRSCQVNGADCSMKTVDVPKTALAPDPAIQQQISQYNRLGVMDPSLMRAIMHQQAAAVAMARAQNARAAASSNQRQQQSRGKSPYAKRANAA